MGHLKLKDGTSFPLNLSVGEIRDISKRKGTFSKTITLVGDDDNNNLLNHYYDVNVVAGTFDVNKLQQCQIIQNGIVILDNAYMQLIEVVKSQTTDAHNQQIEYKVLVKDSVSDFFTKIGNKLLTEINMEEIVNGGTPITYTSANVSASFNNTITDGYKFVIPYDIGTTLSLKSSHPAMYAKTYFDAIFQGAGFTYEWGNQSPGTHTTNDNYFEKLLIPYNGGTPQIDREDYLVEATKASLTTSGSGLTWNEQVIGFTEVTDGENIFDHTNGDYAVPFWIQTPEAIQVQVTIDFDIDMYNNAGVTANRVGTGNITVGLATKEQAQSQYYGQNLYNWQPPATIAATTTHNVVTGGTATLTFNATNIDNTDILEFFVRSFVAGNLVSYDQTVDVDVTINSSTWKIIPSADTIGYQADLNLNTYIPKQIKQADYIKSIFMMYNLYAEVDKSQPNKIILKSRDDYYDAGSEVDWTAKLAKDQDQTLQFLPELSAKKMVLSYKDDTDTINTVYKEATNETYGQIEYTFENEYVKGIDRKELIFSPTPIVTTQFNAYVPALGYIPETNIRILVDGGTQTCDQYSIIDVYGSVQTDTTTAPLITHFDDPVTPSFDLNFATCDYYFYSELSQKTNNNLYNLYWRRTLGQIDKGKMLTAWFDLNEVDIQSLKLNDKIRIDNSWWHINRVIDYDANEHKLTKVELISVDEEIEFTPFATTPSVPVRPVRPIRPVRPVKPTKPETVRPVKDIIDKNNEAKNLYTGDVTVKGINNYVSSDVQKAIVVGDNKNVEEDGMYTPMIDIEDKLVFNGYEITDIKQLLNFANGNLTLTGNRTHDLDGNTFEISDGGYTAEWFYLGGGLSYLGYGNSDFEVSSTFLKLNYNGENRIEVNATETVINEGAVDRDFRIEGLTNANLVYVDATADRVGIGKIPVSYQLDVNGNGRFDSGLVINDGANNSDTRIEGQSDANLFFIDASTDRVGIGTNTPAAKLHVRSSGSSHYLTVQSTTLNNAGLRAYNTVADWRYICNSAGDLQIYDGTSVATPLQIKQGAPNYSMYFATTELIINQNAANLDFRVAGQTDTNLFFTDASTDRVGIGTNTPSYKLDVNGDVNVASGSAYRHNGTAGLSGTYTFGGGTTGDIATMTFNGGILTAVTTVP